MRRDVFQAIADPTRREIISLISKQSLNLNAIADNFDVSRPAISQHIKVLTECGVIIIKQTGRERYCETNFKKLAEVADWIAPFQKMWEERYERLDSILDNMQKKPKKILRKK